MNIKANGTSRVKFLLRGNDLNFEAIALSLGVAPTNSHREGDQSRIKNKPFPCDYWELESPLDESEPLDVHLKWLANTIRPHYNFIKSLKSNGTDVSVFWGYITEVEQNDFSLSPEAMKFLVELEIPLDFSLLAIR